jgi:diguanylate cyclase (GGDEF)-like protein
MLMYIDADNFKAFNDKYGFEKGDNVIKLISVIIRGSLAELGNNTDYIGHIGGDDFVLITSKEKVEQLAKRIIRDFESLIAAEYDEQARAAGCIEGLDRQNNKCKFPLMSLSIGAAGVEPGKYHHYSQAVEKVKEVLKLAKQEQGNTFKQG